MTWLHKKGRVVVDRERGKRKLGQGGSLHRLHLPGGRAGTEVGPAGIGDTQAFHHQQGVRGASVRLSKLMAAPGWGGDALFFQF